MWKGFEILQPYGWSVSETDEIRFTSPNGKNSLTIQRHTISPDWGLSEFADHYLGEWLNQARTWNHYRRISAQGTWVEGNNIVELHFERQTTPDACMEDGMTHIHKSWMQPKIGYTITITMCLEDPEATTLAKRLQILASFIET